VPEPVDPDSPLRRHSRLAAVESPDRFVILDLDHVERPPVILGGSAAQIWSLLDGTRSTAEIVRVIVDGGAPRVEVEPGVSAFVEDLRRLGLIVDVGAGRESGSPCPR
jgi:hypothetical protein